MQLIYCLINQSLNDNIVSIGITKSLSTLKQTLQIINLTYLPTPYTIYLTKNVKTSEHIDFIYSILNKFGTHINGTFFEISLDFIEQLFNLIQDDIYTDDEILQNEYIVIQDKIEYIIPCVVGANVVGANVVGANVVGANVVGANVVGANVVGANVVGANVVGANVVGANKIESNISSIILEIDTHYDKLTRYNNNNTYIDLDL